LKGKINFKKIILKFLSLPSIKLIPNTPIEQEMDGRIGDDVVFEGLINLKIN